MTDGITLGFRDSRITDKIEEIRGLQRKFSENNSPELAKNIIDRLNVIKSLPQGFFNTVNKYKVEQDIQYYQRYLENNVNS